MTDEPLAFEVTEYEISGGRKLYRYVFDEGDGPRDEEEPKVSSGDADQAEDSPTE